MGWLFGGSYKKSKKEWRNREEEGDDRHWTTQRGEALYSNDEGAWPEQEEFHIDCAVCGGAILGLSYKYRKGLYYHKRCI